MRVLTLQEVLVNQEAPLVRMNPEIRWCQEYHLYQRVQVNLGILSVRMDQYSSLSNKRDDHGTFTSPKVTLITLLLASITHTRVACRAHKFFKFKDQNSK